ncbi:sensor histidine kinase [Gordonia sp. HY285]|uniref:sensor histidine kinase n=1 Tax=Gordonia liuliyuniae TaxID=2911517 RepID=UPI001F4286DD|nr:sensor histidine kinase [Gordonia liuliyuniae]MCF8611631.1 sensor histidine kinase [Gordonia liuliyuniae]
MADDRSTDRYAEWAGHILFTTLMIVGVANTVVDDRTHVLTLVCAGLFAVWYAIGAVWSTRGRSDLVIPWVLILTAGWIGLSVVSSDFVWIAFVVAMLCWHFLPRGVAVAVAVVIAATAVTTVRVDTGRFTVGGVIGPLIGIATAVAVTEAFGRITTMVVERDRLVDELIATREQLAERERDAGVMAERERLGGEIHDGTGQSLASIIMLLRAATSPSTPPEQRTSQTATALETAQTALAESRRFLRGLDGPQSPAEGLSGALAEQVAALSHDGVPTVFAEHGVPGSLPEPVQVALQRTVQEALLNVRRHAGARSAAVTLTHLPGEVHLDIVDDGVGMDPDNPSPAGDHTAGSGFGLRAMRARIRSCSGELTVESTPADGTTIHVNVPIERH